MVLDDQHFLNAKHKYEAESNIFTFFELYYHMKSLYDRLRLAYQVESLTCYNRHGENIMEVNEDEMFPLFRRLLPCVSYDSIQVTDFVKKIISEKEVGKTKFTLIAGKLVYGFYTPSSVTYNVSGPLLVQNTKPGTTNLAGNPVSYKLVNGTTVTISFAENNGVMNLNSAGGKSTYSHSQYQNAIGYYNSTNVGAVNENLTSASKPKDSMYYFLLTLATDVSPSYDATNLFILCYNSMYFPN